MERLKDEADLPAPKLGESVFADAGYRRAVDSNLPGTRRIESGDEAEKGRFAASRRSCDRDELAIRNGQIEGVKDCEDFGSRRNLLGDLA